MDYKKKLKIRLSFAIAYLLIGIALIAVSLVFKSDIEILSSFGTALAFCGLARIRKNALITKSEESIRKQEIRETDERNIAISARARGIALTFYILAACTGSTILYLMDMRERANMLALSVSFIVFVYWLSYLIISKKS